MNPFARVPGFVVVWAENVYPDLSGVGGRSTLVSIVGALLTFVLIVAVLMLIISGIVWAVSSSTGNAQAAQKGKVGVFVALGAAVFAGAAVTWMNFLLRLGDGL
ncbi:MULTISPECIES: DUF6112 family protein [Microbacteriaceae]|jgi:Family of unknown function (DUF6112)|uniref:Integral membrane protein n=1 Tax=Leucobacter chromiisoli TaxID=2796471 RepID=A0A934Q8M1_9MICO|nr:MULTISPECIES: DUF6112 family protein [Microbacteriaceae]ALJ20908.1 hypothetical protein AOA12_13765 [Microbacterium sp. No. 7]MBK0420255.1 hypothetical protein [Leucobacter chromiisoli]MCD1572367.1 DUF6112 family protein [Agromyces mediolanus]